MTLVWRSDAYPWDFWFLGLWYLNKDQFHKTAESGALVTYWIFEITSQHWNQLPLPTQQKFQLNLGQNEIRPYYLQIWMSSKKWIFNEKRKLHCTWYFSNNIQSSSSNWNKWIKEGIRSPYRPNYCSAPNNLLIGNHELNNVP